jgi:tetratricopeptide (TPR) repeat protein
VSEWLNQLGRYAAVVCALAGLAGAQSLNECLAAARRGKLADARSCYTRLAGSADSYLRAEGLWGIGRYSEANDQFRAAVKAQPKNAQYLVRWGRFYLDRFQKGEAATCFEDALEIDKNHAGALLGLAMVASGTFEQKAVELAEQALKADPKLVEAHELLARLALEDNDPERAIKEADKAMAISPEALDAMAVRATIDWLDDKTETSWLKRILEINPVYGEVYSVAGYFFVINRRYEEGIRFYRKAIELRSDLWKARIELGINLMRVGEDVEARKHLELAYENNESNEAARNTLRLLDSYKNFVTLKTASTVLRLDRKEADLLRVYMQPELERAIRTFEKKYRMKLDRPVQLEVYPNHEDFAVRTLGLPGLGALGVTFGYVVAMDSPSGRQPGAFHWASTLWHELSHVFVLGATKHRVPRWFTEGMAVHEETAISPEWGDRLDPQAITAIQKKKLLPIAQLDRGFVRPSYPAQVVVSYFQAGRVCDYIVEKWGYDKLLAMMHAFGEKKSTPQVIEEQLGLKPEAFDQQFLPWLEAKTKKTVEGFEEWRKRLRVVAEAAKKKEHDEVIREGLAIRDLYGDYVEPGSVYEFLADAYFAKDDKKSAAAELERYARIGGRSPLLLKKLATLQEEQGNKKAAAETLARLNYIYPVNDEDLHRRLGDLHLAGNDLNGAIREYQAVVASKPIDQAASHFNLAKAYRMANRLNEAKEHVVLALEAAPGYRPAQKLLLELNQ